MSFRARNRQRSLSPSIAAFNLASIPLLQTFRHRVIHHPTLRRFASRNYCRMIISSGSMTQTSGRKVKVPVLDAANPADLLEAATLLRQGKLVAFPTETVYGLGADARSEAAVRSIFLAKGRPSDNPLIIHFRSMEAIRKSNVVAEISPLAEMLATKFWPGPLTMVLPRSENAKLARTVHANLSSVAVRVPNNPVTLELLRQVGEDVPIAAPSANISGRPSPTRACHVVFDFETMASIEQASLVGAVLDGDSSMSLTQSCEYGVESTVVDLTVSTPTILRPGAISKEMLEEATGWTFILHQPKGNAGYAHTESASLDAPKAPGMKYRHYAPSMPVYIAGPTKEHVLEKIREFQKQSTKEQRIGVLADEQACSWLRQHLDSSLDSLEFVPCGKEHDTADYTRNLYAALRRFEEDSLLGPHVHLIVAQSVSESSGLGVAAMNRLRKAAGAKHDALPDQTVT